MEQNVIIVTEPTGKKFVLINDLRFKGKTKEEWNDIEVYLKEYIGKDFPDEFTHGQDKIVL